MTLGLATSVGLAAASDALHNPAVQEVLVMADAGLEQSVIFARVEAIGAFPELDGHDLAELKRRGVSDAILLRIIELGTPDGRPSQNETPIPEQTLAGDDSGSIRVYVERPFRITYYEVTLDGKLVHTIGEIHEGSASAGRKLKRPVAISQSERFVAFEGTMAPGTTTVSVGYAVSMVESDPADEWGEYAAEHYLTRGIRATGVALPGQDERGNPGATCVLEAAQVCEVTAYFDRTTPARLGGFPVYSVRYEVRAIDRAFAGR
jgi:hypothetical protein